MLMVRLSSAVKVRLIRFISADRFISPAIRKGWLPCICSHAPEVFSRGIGFGLKRMLLGMRKHT